MKTTNTLSRLPADQQKLITEFEKYLIYEGMSGKTVKNYVADINEFLSITNLPSQNEKTT